MKELAKHLILILIFVVIISILNHCINTVLNDNIHNIVNFQLEIRTAKTYCFIRIGDFFERTFLK